MKSIHLGVDGAPKWLALQAALTRASDDGKTIPCRGPRAHLWQSRAHADREAAIWRCRTCPALDPCKAWALAGPEQTGVWGAVDLTPAQQQRNPSRRSWT